MFAWCKNNLPPEMPEDLGSQIVASLLENAAYIKTTRKRTFCTAEELERDALTIIDWMPPSPNRRKLMALLRGVERIAP